MKAVRENHFRSADIGERYYIFCPGCREVYRQRYPDDPRFWDSGGLHCFSLRVHQFNGDLERPTLSPSLLCSYDWGEPPQKFVCHSFVRDGQIQYLSDCTHSMAGQTVDLLDVPVAFQGGEG